MAGVTTQGKIKRRRRFHLPPIYLLLSLPPVVYLLALFFAPLAFLMVISFYRFDAGLMIPDFTLENYRMFFTDPFYLAGYLRTFVLASLVASIVTLISYPVAYFLTRTHSRFKGLFFALVLAPELSGVVLRTYGWLVILDDGGIINSLLLELGLIEQPLQLARNFIGVAIGLVHVLLPFGILSIFSTLQSIDPVLERAASNLGANRVQSFFRVLLPLSLPGILGAFFLSFTLTASSYATPSILGGSGFFVLATMIYDQLLFFLNWPLAAVMAFVLLVSVLIVIAVGSRLENRVERAVQG